MPKTDSDLAFLALEEIRSGNSDIVVAHSVNTFEEQFTFLSTFLDCAQTWSDACEIVPDLVAKVAAAVKDILEELRGCAGPVHCCAAYVLLYRDIFRPDRRSDVVPASELLHSFARLNEKMEVLKQEIGDAYCSTYLSMYVYIPLRLCSYLWFTSRAATFCSHVESNLQVLVEKSDLSDSLKKQMAELENYLYRLRRFLKRREYDYIASSESGVVEAHYASVVIHAAHLCCACWAAKMDRDMENGVSVVVLDLKQKIDLAASPEFLDMVFKYLVNFEVKWEKTEVYRYFSSSSCKLAFLEELLQLQETTLIYQELFLLLSWPARAQGMHHNKVDTADRLSLDIKALIWEAAASFKNMQEEEYCRQGDQLIHSDTILLAKIWFVKVEVFLASQIYGITLLPGLSMDKGSRILMELVHSLETTENYQIMTLIEELPGQVESVYRSSDVVEEIKGDKIRHIRDNFLLQVTLLKAKKQLLELLNNDNASLTAKTKCQMGMLDEGLGFMIAFVKNQPTDMEKQLLTSIEHLAAAVLFPCNSYEADKATDQATADEVLSIKLCKLLDMLQTLKGKLLEVYLQLPRLKIPRTPGLCFVEFLLQSLWELLSHMPDPVARFTLQIEALCKNLEPLISSIGDTKAQGVENHEQRDLYERLHDAAYLAEYAIDSIVVQSSTKWHQFLWLNHASEEIRCIEMQIENVTEKQADNVKVHDVVRTFDRLTSKATSPSIDELMVVLKDQEDLMINQVTRGSLERNVVSIAGMAGIGKTTLANKIFHHPKVINHFHVRAWCSVSQEYRKRDLLLKILSHINKLDDNIVTMPDEDLMMKLRQKLMRNRYLIVLDDVWNIGAWDDLESSFPNDSNGSRILITSRLHSVVSEIQPESDPHHLRPLSGDESWQLLEMKAFHGKGCPEELMQVGKQISENCEGLPLSVVAVAGLLEKMTNKPDQWKEIAETLSSHIVHDPQTRCKDILELSYNHLPDELKACFLYFGQFLNGKDIPVQKLIRMWIAEGFVQKTEAICLEDHAEHYLKDLIGRNLVLVAKRRSDGGVKACRLHDMLYELCLSKGKDEKFSRQITSHDEPYASFDDSVYGDDFDHFMPSNFQEYEERRLSFYVKRKHFILSRPSGPYVRSLLLSALSDANARRPHDVSFISDNFKLLKVLDLECICMIAKIPNGIFSLVHLRYLAISGYIDSIPSSIAHLWNLETLIVKGLVGKVLLPDTIWSMTKLRHLHVNNQVVFTLQDEMTGDFCILENLLSLSFPSFSYGEGTEKIINRLPNLRKLKCTFYSELEHSSTSSNRFPRLELLAKLESLKVVHYGRAVDGGEFNFPLSLKRLTLSNFRLPWNHISAIGSLPNLEVLKLVSRAFEGRSWEMKVGEFLKLKFLQLEGLSIVQWDASSDHLPELQQLVLRDCKQLEGVPLEFVEIPTLQIIHAQNCGHSVEESLRRIQEEQLESGIVDLKVLIGPAD